VYSPVCLTWWRRSAFFLRNLLCYMHTYVHVNTTDIHTCTVYYTHTYIHTCIPLAFVTFEWIFILHAQYTTYIHTYMHTSRICYIWMDTHLPQSRIIHLNICKWVYEWVYEWVCTSECTSECMSEYMHVCVWVSVWVSLQYININKPTQIWN